MRDLRPIVRLIATLLFGLLVLALLSLLSVQMATHHFQGVAERTIRQVFSEATQTKADTGHDTACRGTGVDPERLSACDPHVIKAERSFRSATCRPGGFFQLLGKRWRCVAKFTDGATLDVDVSLGLGRHELELVLPICEPDAPPGTAADCRTARGE